ncbi:unnamed protein product [Pleuronectes platessa]|uniref:Uncharacterized protein n=1 Tax=Pleuronectes platessa TaxID=8262 RepID=A0A9N7VQF5_PLEPL|nr:unnamed protein product [Pleuronectes platessa]
MHQVDLTSLTTSLQFLGCRKMFHSWSGQKNQWEISPRDGRQRLYNSAPYPQIWPQFSEPHPGSATRQSPTQYAYGGGYERPQSRAWRQSQNTLKVGIDTTDYHGHTSSDC